MDAGGRRARMMRGSAVVKGATRMITRKTIVMFSACVVLATAYPQAAQRWGTGPVPRNGVCFYRDTNFRGDYFCADTGEDIDRMPSGMNDRISSIRLFGRAEVTVFQDVRFGGRSSRFT